jgi:choline monooxygenase
MSLQAPPFDVRVAADISQARGLPSACYTSEEFATRERDHVLARAWTCVGLASDVPARHAMPTSLLGLPLAVVADGGGKVRVFHNVCRHRGYRLVTEPCKVQGSLRCPYHSWAYGLDGSLKATPHIGGPGVHEVEGFDKASAGLLEVRSAVWFGLVFVNLSGDAASFESHIAPLVSRWSAYVGETGLHQLRAAKTGSRMEMTVESNWKLPVENYCESYHLPWVHPGLNTYSRLEDHYHIMEGDVGAGQGTYAFNCASREGISLPTFPEWPQDRRNEAEYIALFPNVLLGLQVDHAYAIWLEPLGVARTREVVEITYVGEEALEDRFAEAREKILEGWREVFAEDIHAVEGMQAGRASPAFDGGIFSPVMDNPTHHFHRWVASRMDGI